MVLNPFVHLGFLWALPATITGGLAAILTGSVESLTWDPKYRAHVAVLRYGSPVDRAFAADDALAGCIGTLIFVRAEWILGSPIIMNHEATHVRENMVMGIFAWPIYYLASLVARIRGLDSYEHNWFEVHAQRSEAVGRPLNLWE